MKTIADYCDEIVSSIIENAPSCVIDCLVMDDFYERFGADDTTSKGRVNAAFRSLVARGIVSVSDDLAGLTALGADTYFVPSMAHEYGLALLPLSTEGSFGPAVRSPVGTIENFATVREALEHALAHGIPSGIVTVFEFGSEPHESNGTLVAF